MTDTQTTLLLTRPERDSAEFLDALRDRLGRDVPAIISPVLRIEPVGEIGDLSEFETIIATSRNAVMLAGRKLEGLEVATVGTRTAEAAVQFGARVTCLGEDVESFLGNTGKLKGPAIYLRGVHSRGNLADRARDAGVLVEERVIYDQIAQELSAEAQALLASGNAIVPVFSPRTAALLSGNRIALNVMVFAISEATAASWRGGGKICVAPDPDRNAMLDLVASVL